MEEAEVVEYKFLRKLKDKRMQSYHFYYSSENDETSLNNQQGEEHTTYESHLIEPMSNKILSPRHYISHSNSFSKDFEYIYQKLE